MIMLVSRAYNSHIDTDIIRYSQLTFGRLLSADDSSLGLSDQLPLGLGQAQGTQREQHKALHDDKWGVWGAICRIYFPLISMGRYLFKSHTVLVQGEM